MKLKWTMRMATGMAWFAAAFSVAAAPKAALHAFTQQHTPTGWKSLPSVQGDLNRDGRADVVWVIEQTDPKNIKRNEALGAEQLNLNPRRLLIGLQSNTGYVLHSQTDGLLPSEHSEETPCLADPLSNESTPITIKKGVLSLRLHYWYSCGTWFTNTETYRFRLDERKRFRLIGRDSFETHRASGETHLNSRNLLTGQQIDEHGNFSEDKPAKIKRSTFKLPAAQYLDALKLNDNDD